MDVIVSLCGNAMVIIDQPVIILTSIDISAIIISSGTWSIIHW